MLDKANCFFKIRTHIGQDYLKLKSLSPATFHRTTKKELFKKNIRRLTQEDSGSEVLLPLLRIQENENDQSNISLLILTCFSLSDVHFREIEAYGMCQMFPHMLRRVIRKSDIPSIIMNKFLAVIVEICGRSEISSELLGELLILNAKLKLAVQISF